jgi:hypothetical protein
LELLKSFEDYLAGSNIAHDTNTEKGSVPDSGDSIPISQPCRIQGINQTKGGQIYLSFKVCLSQRGHPLAGPKSRAILSSAAVGSRGKVISFRRRLVVSPARARFLTSWLRPRRACHPSGSSDMRYSAAALALARPRETLVPPCVLAMLTEPWLVPSTSNPQSAHTSVDPVFNTQAVTAGLHSESLADIQSPFLAGQGKPKGTDLFGAHLGSNKSGVPPVYRTTNSRLWTSPGLVDTSSV